MAKSPEIQEELHELATRMRKWMDKFGWLLVLPFAEPRAVSSKLKEEALLYHIRQDLAAEGAALFLVRDDDPNRLELVSGFGYEDKYRDEGCYYLNQPALTSYVFSNKVPINMSAVELDEHQQKLARGEGGIPCTGKCKDYLESGEFRNIVAAPVVFEGNPLGVLKLENKADTGRSERFPEKDYVIVQILASMIAIVLQQRIYTRLWTRGEFAAEICRSQDEYISQITAILSQALNAECCSLFVKDEELDTTTSILRFGGGVGYKGSYAGHKYPLPTGNERATSLTAHIAQMRSSIHATEKQLATGMMYERSQSGVPYSGKCRGYIASGTFRNILAVALVDSFDDRNAPCLGVLKLENRKEGMEFGKYDEEICKAFVARQVVPALKKFRSSRRGRRSRTGGLDILIKNLGPSARLDGERLTKRLSEALRLKNQNRSITNDDCIRYLQISRATFYREKNKRKAPGNSSD